MGAVVMYSFIVLGIIPGTDIQITFTIWCLICLGIGTFYLEYRRNANFQAKTDIVIDNVLNKAYAFIAKHRLAHIAGNQGLSVQLEIFKQQQASSVRSFLRQLGDTFKVKR